MLPNLEMPPLHIWGPIKLEPFGVLTGTAVIVGYFLARRRARAVGLDPNICANGMVIGVVAGFAVAHWVAALFYFPGKVAENPLYLLHFWDGISSFGGLLGGPLAAALYFRAKGESMLRHLDAILFGFVPAWIIGRLACTIAFDHPGTTTEFFLGMADKEGVARHNLGFYEMLLAVALTGLLFGLRRLRPADGFFLGLIAVIYAPVRFVFDMLRTGDATYLGLTAGQYFAVALLVLGVVLLVRGRAGRSGGVDAAEEHADQA